MTKKGKAGEGGTNEEPSQENPGRKSIETTTEEKCTAPSHQHNAASAKPAGYVVGIGASAGGLKSLEEFFGAVPTDSGLSYVVVSHMGPDQPSMLSNIIGRGTKLPVAEVTDGLTLEPDRVYVIPPGKSMVVMNGRLQLLEPETARVYSPIDTFFQSLAQDAGEAAIGIVLSGTGTDGTEGLRNIKAELGLAICQDPATASFKGMPESGIATGIVDLVLAPGAMPGAIVDYVKRHELGKAPDPDAVDERFQAGLQKIFYLLRRLNGHDFSNYKRNTIVRRVQRRMQLHQIDDVENYLRYLQRNENEARSLYKDFLIGVTSFFRDKALFETVGSTVIPKIFSEKDADEPVRVWIPGVSTGEEAYSYAILFKEYMESNQRDNPVQIFATDVDEEAIARARNGKYPLSVASQVGKERHERFFESLDNHCQVRRDVREMVVFAVQNALKDPPFMRVDLISCRNFLIYLNGDVQRKILPIFHYSLRPKGFLVLGTSESIGEFSGNFTTVSAKWKVYQRKDTAPPMEDFVQMPIERAMREESGVRSGRNDRTPDLSERVSRHLLHFDTPPSVVINAKGEILYVHGRTGKFLEAAPGSPRMNVFDMARGELRQLLSVLVRKATKKNEEVRSDRIHVSNGNGPIHFNVVVRPLEPGEDDPALFLVLFQEHRDVLEERLNDPSATRDEVIQELERELKNAREDLQLTVEEMETSNEELQSMNEEYQSTNEELKSANEELETSREEMQSLNEELSTVNEELHAKIEELGQSHHDMQRFMDSMDIPTIFLDTKLNILRYTSQTNRIVNIRPEDVGRPISHLTHNLKGLDLEREARHVQETLRFVEQDAESTDGRWHFVRILPHRSNDRELAGTVVTFVDVTELKLAKQRALEAQYHRRYADSIFATISQPLIVLDEQLRVYTSNRSYQELFETTAREIDKKHFFNIHGGCWEMSGLIQWLEAKRPDHPPLVNYEVDCKMPNGSQKKLLVSATTIFDEGLNTGRTLVAIAEPRDTS